MPTPPLWRTLSKAGWKRRFMRSPLKAQGYWVPAEQIRVRARFNNGKQKKPVRVSGMMDETAALPERRNTIQYWDGRSSCYRYASINEVNLEFCKLSP